MKKSTMTASKVTYFLLAAGGILIIGIIACCVLAASMLQTKATEATHAAIDAEISDGATTRALDLEAYLKDNASLVDNTAQIAGSIGQYQQNTIIATVSEYARKAGVSVTGFNFGTAATSTAAATGETTMTIGSPVAYTRFVVFLNLLENGTMPTTVTSAQISPDSGDPSNISVSEIKIKVAN